MRHHAGLGVKLPARCVSRSCWLPASGLLSTVCVRGLPDCWMLSY